LSPNAVAAVPYKAREQLSSGATETTVTENTIAWREKALLLSHSPATNLG
jgi:hypothetical protein